MKTIQFLQSLILAITLATGFTACDNCANMACTNGTCKDGACNCNAGYYLNNKNCIAVNMKYVGTGTATATQVWVDTFGTTTTPPDVAVTLLASTTNPYNFTLVRFKNIIKNDLVFTVSSTDDGVLTSLTGVANASGNTYNLSGTKVGSRVTLTISEIGGNTYTLKYGA